MGTQSDKDVIVAPYLAVMLAATEYKAEMLRIAFLSIDGVTSSEDIYDAIAAANAKMHSGMNAMSHNTNVGLASRTVTPTTHNIDKWVVAQQYRRSRVRALERRSA